MFTGGSKDGEQVMEREHVLCVVLLLTFLVQDLFPLEMERRLALLIFGPNLFGLMVVVLFCLFDTSVGLYDYLEKGEFRQRKTTTTREEALLISATNLVLVIAHIKTYRLRYCLHLLLEERAATQEMRAAVAEEAQVTGLQVSSSMLLGRPKDTGRLRHHSKKDSGQKKDL
eukprot:CAMPEP_0183395798 /NCGR_PEP_ID=MMETSP0370-20130417/9579_1 /TAXON_ID=268820 /ORGANISM="Peridinium aciculiferum, Strain PAER-2" /LENGTH=170 /DNA_ID=CAMNT_0025576481 /DNA_START=182 /DNA_END=694 /DNA_ORIENTATION=+